MRQRYSMGARALGLAVVLMLAVGATAAQDLQDTVNQGWQSLQAGKLSEARQAFQSVLDASPTYDFGWYALGQVATREGKYDEAISHFEKATELNPDKFEYHYGLAAALRTKKEYAKAIAALNNAEHLAADKQSSYYLHLERGLSYLSIRQYPRAVEDLAKAVEIQPGDQMAEQRLGMAYYGVEEYGQAAQHLRTAAAKDPGDYTANLYLARSLVNLGQREPQKEKKTQYYNDAAKAAQAAVAKKSGFESQNVLAKAYLGAKNFPQASRAFQEVVKVKPDYCIGLTNLGQSYIGQQAWGPASDALEKAAKCDAKTPVTFNLLAFSLVKQQRREEALMAYEKSYSMKEDPAIAGHITRVKENIRIAAENQQIDTANEELLAVDQAEREQYEKEMAKFEAEQEKIKKYEDEADD